MAHYGTLLTELRYWRDQLWPVLTVLIVLIGAGMGSLWLGQPWFYGAYDTKTSTTNTSTNAITSLNPLITMAKWAIKSHNDTNNSIKTARAIALR